MGLPIWRDPDEQPKRKSALKADPTAAARSSIRRRASVHGSRARRLTRDPTFVPPRIERSPPASISVRYSRRNGVPPIQSLLEHADRDLPLPPPPPPVPLSRNYYTLERRERELRDSLQELHAQAANLRRDAQDFIQSSSGLDSDPWTETERRTLLGTAAAAAQSRRSTSQRRRSRGALPTENQESSDTQNTRDLWRSAIAPSVLVIGGSAEPIVAAPPRSLLPTPPLDQSEPDGDSLFVPGATSRPLHPLSHSWRAESPLNGLGDRNRSPTPTDAWEIMETTIPPDQTLVSAESSFATAPTSISFASSNDTTITEPEPEPASDTRRPRATLRDEESHENSDSDSASSIDIDCTDEEYLAQAESFARELFHHEMTTPEGRARIISNVPNSDRPFNPVDVGFSLIDSALTTEEGRERVTNLGGRNAFHRIVRFRDPAHRQNHNRAQSPPYRPRSPSTTSQDPPSANPVSPPSRGGSREFNDILINLEDGNEQQDLDTMRRVARRLATREEVPDDWWASMGLRINPSIARPRYHRRARSPDGVRRQDMHVERAISRVRGGRIDRGDARL